jgi:predicted outer membrane repeat protein
VLSSFSMIPSTNLNYVVVDSDAGLDAALAAGNNSSYPTPYYIYLSAQRTYTLSAPATVNYGRYIKLYGLGSGITTVRINANTSTAFIAYTGGALDLYDLTITRITNLTPPGYGGAVNNNGGTMKISGVVFQGNVASGGGGAIYNAGTLTITNTIFSGNQAGGGGAIQNQGNLNNTPYNLACMAFDSNRADYGGAILNFGGAVVNITSSRFSGNASTIYGGGAIYNSSPSIATAEGNWWPTWAANPPPVSTVPSTDTIFGFTVTSVAAADPITNPATCQKPRTQTPTVEEELSDYRVALSGTWSTADKDQIRIGVRNAALALAIQSRRAPIDAFNTIIIRPDNELKLVKSTVAAGGQPFAYCTTNIYIQPIIISCFYNNLAITEYTMVHELGHVFNFRSRQNGKKSFFEYIDDTNKGTDYIQDSQRKLPVMGRFISPGGSADWRRGTRGWGTGPDTSITSFQQHPPSVTQFLNDDRNTQVDETSADMFLNWVYRISDPNLPISSPTSLTGFRNISWSPAADSDLQVGANVCNSQFNQQIQGIGCPDSRNPGNARFDWMNDNDSNTPLVGKMSLIFTDQGWNLP